ncbi:MAG TPA: hypothetical protein VHS13_07945 [Edaphobacter sp.]|jgi:hypothetical protein|nr:hypothetical protein [Edaphobacter sp.]
MLIQVSDLKFAQPARRNLLAPVLLAFLILGIVLALLLRFTPHKTADLSIIRTTIYPTHTVFKSDSIVVANQHAEDALYVLTTLRIDDRLHLPLFLKDFTATLTTAEGEEVTTSAVEKPDLENVYTSFPELKPLASEPLLRDTMISPGQSAEGMILLHFPVTKEVWDHRRTAVLNVDLYHQGQQPVLITRASEAVSSPTSPLTPNTSSSPTH